MTAQDRRFWWLLLAITLFGALARLLYMASYDDGSLPWDGDWYHQSANLLADGHPFVEPFTDGRVPTQEGQRRPDGRPPLWTSLRAVPAVVGFTSVTDHRLVAVAVGSAAVLLVGLAGRRIAGRRVGLVAAGLAAVYTPFWIYEVDLLSEPLAIAMTAVVLLVAYRFIDRPGVAHAAWLGVSTTLLALTRAENLLLVPLLLILVALWPRGAALKDRVRWAAVGAAAAALLVVPWSLYCMSRFEGPVTTSTGLGVTMVIGNCDRVYERPHLGDFDSFCRFVDPPDPGDDQAQQDAHYRSVATTYMRDHPGDVPLVMAARLGRTFGLYERVEEAEEVTMGFRAERPLWARDLDLVMYSALAVLAVGGAVVLWRRRRPVGPLLAIGLPVAFGAMATFGMVRYRATFEVPIVLLAAVAIDALVRGWSARRQGAADADRLQRVGLVAPLPLATALAILVTAVQVGWFGVGATTTERVLDSRQTAFLNQIREAEREIGALDSGTPSRADRARRRAVVGRTCDIADLLEPDTTVPTDQARFLRRECS